METSEMKPVRFPERRRRKSVVAGDNVAYVEGGQVAKATDLTLKNLLGCPYENINMEIKQGQVFAIRGHNGSGKSALLLTLAGRMAFTHGSLDVLGYHLPKGRSKVQRLVGLGLFSGLNDLQESLTISYVVASEFELYGRKPKQEAIDAYLKEWNLDDIAQVRVNAITAQRRVMLGVALAWVGHPGMIVVDDIESQLTKYQSTCIMERLIELAHTRNVAIVVGVIERDLAAMADNALYLEKKGE